MGSWPAISPVSPGVLCALGDATTRMRTETARSFSRLAHTTDAAELSAILVEMADQTRAELRSDGISDAQIVSEFEIDVRYAGQAFEVPLTITQDVLAATASPDCSRASMPNICGCSPSTWIHRTKS